MAEAPPLPPHETHAQQLALLVKFYADVGAAKTEADCEAILVKRRREEAAMSPAAFAKMCETLASKYGKNPLGAAAMPPTPPSEGGVAVAGGGGLKC